MKLRYTRTATVGERIIAFLIDHVILTAVFASTVMSTMLSSASINNETSIIGLVITMVLIPILYGVRDFIDGRSIGKRVFKIGVRCAEDPDELPQKWQLFVRNLTIIIWPVEFLVMAFSTRGERLGDLLAKTIVVKLELLGEEENDYIQEYTEKRDRTPRQSDKNIKKRIVTIIVAFTLVIMLFVSSIFMILKNSEAYELSTHYIEGSSEVTSLIGEVQSYGFVPSGSISTSNNSGKASFKIKVNGTIGDCYVYIDLVQIPGQEWEVVRFKVLN